MQAHADGVIFSSSVDTGRGDFIQVLQALCSGGVYYPEVVRRLVSSLQSEDLPKFVEEVSEREKEVVSAVASGLANAEIA